MGRVWFQFMGVSVHFWGFSSFGFSSFSFSSFGFSSFGFSSFGFSSFGFSSKDDPVATLIHKLGWEGGGKQISA